MIQKKNKVIYLLIFKGYENLEFQGILFSNKTI